MVTTMLSRYDSVIIDGQLRWQDRLNSYNLPFFLPSTGFFTNYTVSTVQIIIFFRDSYICSGHRTIHPSLHNTSQLLHQTPSDSTTSLSELMSGVEDSTAGAD